jgi:hypothetical protein
MRYEEIMSEIWIALLTQTLRESVLRSVKPE